MSQKFPRNFRKRALLGNFREISESEHFSREITGDRLWAMWWPKNLGGTTAPPLPSQADFGPSGAAEVGGVGSVFDRYQGAPRRCLALDIDSRLTGDWQTILDS